MQFLSILHCDHARPVDRLGLRQQIHRHLSYGQNQTTDQLENDLAVPKRDLFDRRHFFLLLRKNGDRHLRARFSFDERFLQCLAL